MFSYHAINPFPCKEKVQYARMCGRFVISADGEELGHRFSISGKGQAVQRFNAAPGQELPVIYTEGMARKLAFMRWGLVPSWSNDPAIGSRMINARSETVETKPSYRSLVVQRRCIVPANGFYEWGGAEKGSRSPYYFFPSDGTILGFAGLYDVHGTQPEQQFLSFTIITVPANSVVAPYHDRMPAILNSVSERLWLSGGGLDSRSVAECLQQPDPGLLEVRKVGKEVNNTANDYPDLLRGS